MRNALSVCLSTVPFVMCCSGGDKWILSRMTMSFVLLFVSLCCCLYCCSFVKDQPVFTCSQKATVLLYSNWNVKPPVETSTLSTSCDETQRRRLSLPQACCSEGQGSILVVPICFKQFEFPLQNIITPPIFHRPIDMRLEKFCLLKCDRH